MTRFPTGGPSWAAPVRVHARQAAAVAVVLLALGLLAGWAAVRAAGTGQELVLVALALGVAGTTLAWGLWPGFVAAAGAVVLMDYAVFRPGSLLSFESPSQRGAALGFALGWTLVCLLIHRLDRRTRAERDARAIAERTAAHSTRIAQLTAALGLARSAEAVMDTAVQEPLHALRADAAMLLLVDEDIRHAIVARAIGYDGAPGVEREGTLRIEPGPLRDTIRRAAPVILESPLDRRIEYGDAADAITGDGFAALAAVPLTVAGHVVAAIRLDFREPRPFTQEDRAFVEALSTHAAHALERLWEQEADQRARIEAEDLRARADQELARRQTIEQALRASETRYRALATRTTRLHGLTAALSESVTTGAVASAIVQHATVVVGATGGAVWLLTEDGTQFDTIFSNPPPAGGPARVAVEAGLCEAEVIAHQQPVFIRSWDESQERYWRSASAAADAAYVSSSALPLLVDGTTAGVLRFDFSVPVNFDEDYQALLISVAQHCSQALDRARLYESAQRARAEAEAASRLKDDFLSIVSHELRTPLNAVLGWAAMLQKTALEGPIAQRAVQSIHDNAARQAQLIDDLLDISRIAAGRATLDVQEIELVSLVSGVVESLMPVAVSNGVDLQLAPCPPAVVSGDRRRLEQVFFNLVGNALKFTPAGGWIRIDASVAGETVQVIVRDSGIGIDPRFLPHVFERFRQADSTSTRTYGGLGLGLAIAKQLVEAHKGAIVVESGGTGQGASFKVQLPIGAGAAAPQPLAGPAARREPTEAPRLDGTRVLVVDDEPDARDIMACALHERGASVSAAATAAEAFDRLLAEPFHVLIADIAMPGEDGCSLMRRVRTCDNAHVAVIPAAAVTAHAREEERQDVLAAGFNVHLAKPIEPATLARAVRDLAGGPSSVTLSIP